MLFCRDPEAIYPHRLHSSDLIIQKSNILYYIKRLQQNHCFHFAKLNHGFWAGVCQFHQHKKTPYGLDAGYFKEVLDMLSSPPHRQLIVGVSNIGPPDESPSALLKWGDYQKHIGLIRRYIHPRTPLHYGCLLKAAVVNGSIKYLWDAIAGFDVIAVGMPALARLGEIFKFRSFNLITVPADRFCNMVDECGAPIVDSSPHRHRIANELLKMCKARSARTIVILQLGEILGTWIICTVGRQLPAVFMMDVGRAIDRWIPEQGAKQLWLTQFNRFIMANDWLSGTTTGPIRGS